MIKTYNVEEVAELLACDKDTAAERLNSGDLPGLKMGRSWVIPEQALIQRMNEIALEEAAKRREERGDGKHKMRAGRASAAASTSSKSKPVPVGPGRGRIARTPPALPSVVDGWPIGATLTTAANAPT